MSLTAWPTEFFDRKAGIGCPQCEEGRPLENAHGVRFFEGRVSDGYLQKRTPALGYSIVVFRGRHVGEPQAMTPTELGEFWFEIGLVAKAIEKAFGAVHLNFQLLGNADPHVHVHIVPRYDPDPAPCWPLPAALWAQPHALTPTDLEQQVGQLRQAL